MNLNDLTADGEKLLKHGTMSELKSWLNHYSLNYFGSAEELADRIDEKVKKLALSYHDESSREKTIAMLDRRSRKWPKPTMFISNSAQLVRQFLYKLNKIVNSELCTDSENLDMVLSLFSLYGLDTENTWSHMDKKRGFSSVPNDLKIINYIVTERRRIIKMSDDGLVRWAKNRALPFLNKLLGDIDC